MRDQTPAMQVHALWLRPLSTALSRSLFAVGSEFVEGESGIREVDFERQK